MLPVLPVEIWERVINYLWTDAAALAACSLVCKAWNARCRYHLLTSIDLVSHLRTQWFARLLDKDPGLRSMVAHVVIYGAFHKEWTTQGPVPHSTPFVCALARKLPAVQILDIRHAEMQATRIHPRAFVHLASFTNITTLYLCRVAFSSKPICARLICALTNLMCLACEDVVFHSSAVDPSVLPPAPPRVKTLWLDGRSDDVVDLMTSELGLTKFMEDVRIGDSPHCLHSPSGHSVMSLIQHVGPTLKQLMIQLRAPPAIMQPFKTNSEEPKRSWLSVQSCVVLEQLVVGCRLPMSTAEGLDAYRDVYSAWLYDLLDSAASPKLKTLVIILDARLIHYDGVSHLVERAIEFLEQQESIRMDQLLIQTRFKSLESVRVHLLYSRETTSPAYAQWDSVVALRFPKLRERNILRTEVHSKVE